MQTINCLLRCFETTTAAAAASKWGGGRRGRRTLTMIYVLRVANSSFFTVPGSLIGVGAWES